MNYFARLAIVILIVLAVAQFAPRVVNYILVLVLFGMLIMQSDRYSALIAQLKL